MSPFHRGLVKWARTIHLYTTLTALALVLFFSITGFMLNHEDWFGTGDPHTHTDTGSIPTAQLHGPDKLAVVERLRKEFGATGAVDSFEEEGDGFRVVFKSPGRRVEAIIQRSDGATEVTTESRGIAGLFLDLHRGKSTGFMWSLVIDAVAIVLLVISGTGLVMWWSLRGRGRYGLLVIVVGTIVGTAVFFAFVP